MKTYLLPDHFIEEESYDEDEVIIRLHQSHEGYDKNRIILNRNMINLLISGNKTVVYPETTLRAKAGELILLSTGNILTSEVSPGQQGFTSVLLYFSNHTWARFWNKHGIRDSNSRKQPCLIFQQDDYIRQYISSLLALLEMPGAIPAAIKQVKLD